MLFASVLPPAHAETASIELRTHRNHSYVPMQQYMRLVSDLFPDANAQWDPREGILRVEANGYTIDTLTRRPALIVNKKLERAQRPILIHRREVLIPVETVERHLALLGVNFKLETAPVATPTPEPTPLPPSAELPSPLPGMIELETEEPEAQTETPTLAPIATPAPPAFEMAENEATIEQQQPTENVRENEDSPIQIMPVRPSLPTASNEQQPLIEPPAQLGEALGLRWDQLADMRHRQPPGRITVVYDATLASVAVALEQRLSIEQGLEVRLIEMKAGTTRASKTLVADVTLGTPELVIDLVTAQATDGERPILRVWTVNDALWPQDRNSATQTSDPLASRYRNHQFQSLALGSQLRKQLGQAFPEQIVFYELFPSYLLRRLDAPGAAVLIPTTPGTELPSKRLATAIANATDNYIRAMRSVAF